MKIIGSHVRHTTDPHSRNRGVIIDSLFRYGHSLVQVRWRSGVVETLHPDELVFLNEKEKSDD